MRKKISNFVNAKKVVLASAMGTAMGTALSVVGIGHCEIRDPDAQIQGIMKAIFNVLTIGGVVLIAVGLVTLIRAIISPDDNEQVYDHKIIYIDNDKQRKLWVIGKGLAMLLGGVLLVAARWLVKKVIGQDPVTLTIF